MNINERLWKIFTSTMLLLLMSSCVSNVSAETITQTLPGKWLEMKGDCDPNIPNNCGEFHFRNDGTFHAKNVPEQCFGYVRSFSSTGRIDIDGNWDIQRATNERYVVNLRIQMTGEGQADTRYVRLLEIYNTRRPNLYCWFGDEANQFVFKKENGQLEE